MSELDLIPHETKFPHFGDGVFGRLPVGAIFACKENEDDPDEYIYDPDMSLKDIKQWVVKSKNASWIFIDRTDRV